MSDETLQSNAAAAADAAADAAVDSDPTMGDTNAAALQEPGEHQEPVVGLLLAVCYYHGVDRAFSSTCDCFCLWLAVCLQYLDAVGWAAGRASGL